MDGRILLDTNIVIDLFAGDEGIKDRLGRAEEVFVPAVVLGELYYGAQRSSRAQTNLAKKETTSLHGVPCFLSTSLQHRNTG